jgi:hypothetical protein
MVILYEFLLLVLAVCFVGWLLWKFVLSKNPLVRSWLRQELVEEKVQIADNLSESAADASKIDLDKVAQNKQTTDEVLQKFKKI